MRDLRRSRIGIGIIVAGLALGALAAACWSQGVEWVAVLLLFAYLSIVLGGGFALLRGSVVRTSRQVLRGIDLGEREGARLDEVAKDVSGLRSMSEEAYTTQTARLDEIRAQQAVRFDEMERRGRTNSRLGNELRQAVSSVDASSRQVKDLLDPRRAGSLGGDIRQFTRHSAVMSRQIGGIAGGVHQANIARPKRVDDLKHITSELEMHRRILRELLWAIDAK